MSAETTNVAITHQDSGDRGRYIAQVDGSDATGHLDWEADGDNIRIATHTIVPPEIGGRGVAGELVQALVADAREQGFRIDPQCSYVEAMFRRHKEWADLRA